MSLSLILAILLLVGLYLWLKRNRTFTGRRSKPHIHSSPSTSSNMRVRGQTQKQLLRLVGGNREVALRLVDQVQQRYPSQSEQWCWEKAIYDIQRDRRS